MVGARWRKKPCNRAGTGFMAATIKGPRAATVLSKRHKNNTRSKRPDMKGKRFIGKKIVQLHGQWIYRGANQIAARGKSPMAAIPGTMAAATVLWRQYQKQRSRSHGNGGDTRRYGGCHSRNGGDNENNPRGRSFTAAITKPCARSMRYARVRMSPSGRAIS